MTWQLIIDPGHGRMGQGMFDAGSHVGALIEADLTYELALAIEEELQRSGARHQVLHETRKGDGLTLASRMNAAPTNGTLVSLHCESLPKPGINGGRVYCGPHPAAIEIADRLARVINAWGRVTSNRYAGCAPAKGGSAHPWIQREDAICVLVSPFSITAPDAMVYARRISALGKMIGGTLASWAVGRNPAIRCYQPMTAQRDVARGPAAKPMGELFRGRPESPRMNDTVRQISTVSPDDTTE
jgi:hypothetical protein